MLTALLLAFAVPELAPLDFLVGHCWSGTRPEGGVDTHCFTADGAVIREHHQVVANGKTVYQGDTIYRWDPAANAIAFAYASPAGHMSGHVSGTANGLDFGSSFFEFEPVKPSGDFNQATRGVHIRTVWTRIGDTAYDVRDEIREAPEAPVPVRYTRVD